MDNPHLIGFLIPGNYFGLNAHAPPPLLIIYITSIPFFPKKISKNEKNLPAKKTELTNNPVFSAPLLFHLETRTKSLIRMQGAGTVDFNLLGVAYPVRIILAIDRLAVNRHLIINFPDAADFHKVRVVPFVRDIAGITLAPGFFLGERGRALDDNARARAMTLPVKDAGFNPAF
jgi:hypothetical protein